MKYDFDSVIDRRNTGSVKWDFADEYCRVQGALPMWVADMDFRSAEPIVEALRAVADRGIFGYTRATQSYYDAVTGWMKQRYAWDVKKEWIVLSPGVVPALNILVKAFTDPGDQVIVQTPVYYPFFRAIRNNGREILDNPLRFEGGRYVMDLTDLEGKINARSKMIILCSPHNPIGRVWDREELERLGELCIAKGILVVSDEIHADIVYSGYRHTSFATISEHFRDNSVVCTGASKTFNLPGLHNANIIIPNPAIRAKFADAIRACGIMGTNMFGMAATEAAYRYGGTWLAELLPYLEANIGFLADYASKVPGSKVNRPQGTYLAWWDFRDCGIDPARLANFVREEAKVGLEAGTVFGAKEAGFERMNFACPRSTLAEGLRRIEATVRRLTTP